jgi:hypothetical protein
MPPPIWGVRMNFVAFRGLLVNLSTLIDSQPVPSTNKSKKRSARPTDNDGDPGTEEWWLSARAGTSPAEPRTLAYFLSYAAVCGQRIGARAIALDDGYVWPDRDVMKCLLIAGLVKFIEEGEPHFEITDAGLAYLRSPYTGYQI